jgi:hypothetical protein
MEAESTTSVNCYPFENMTTDLVKRRGRGGSRKSKITTDQKRPSPKPFQFINTSHPDDTTSRDSIKLIRSHAARQSRTFRRDTQKQYYNQPSSLQSSIERDEADNDTETDGVVSELQRGNGTRYVKLAPKRLPPILPEALENEHRGRSTSPVQLIGGARKDAYTRFARPLSEDEQYLFDFCRLLHLIGLLCGKLILRPQTSTTLSYMATSHVISNKTNLPFIP